MQKHVRTIGRSNISTRSGQRSFVTGCASNVILNNLVRATEDLVDPGLHAQGARRDPRKRHECRTFLIALEADQGLSAWDRPVGACDARTNIEVTDRFQTG